MSLATNKPEGTLQPADSSPLLQPAAPWEREPAQPELASKNGTEAPEPVTFRHGWMDVARGPVLVDSDPAGPPRHEEIAGQKPVSARANPISHEKMTPTLSGRREPFPAGGDSGMVRTKSWLDRLLRRDTSPARIVPDNDDEDASENHPSRRRTRGDDEYARENYDLPLATRLDQISRQRPVAPASATKASTRLQIVQPDEPFEIVVPARRPVLDEPVPFKQIEAAAVAPEIEAAPAAIPERKPMAVLAEIPAVEPFAFHDVMNSAPAPIDGRAIENARPRRPARPLSFQQLNEMTQERVQTAKEAAVPLPVEAPQPVAESISYAAPAEIPAFPAPEPAQPAIPEHEVASATEPAAAATAYEPAPLPERVPGQVQVRRQDYPAQDEADDIDPVYEHLSRQMTAGRWDPIPTLRPDEAGWRDRPSPIPPVNPNRSDVAQRRWGIDDDLDAWRSEPQAYPTEPMPEPMLTRQWGLLSKFQQSRMSSGQHPVAKTGDDEKPGQGNGKR